MGVKKRIAPATQAHYRLRATKLRKEKRLNQHNGMEDASMGEAPETHEPPTAPPHDPSPQEPPVQIRQEMPKQAQHPPNSLPKNHSVCPTPAENTPPASPTNDSPQSQLELELQGHITAAVASRTTQIKTTGEEVLELVSAVTEKITRWEERSLQGAASLGRDIRTLVLNFSKNLSAQTPDQPQGRGQQPSKTQPTSYAKAMQTAPTTTTSSARPRVQPKTLAERPPRLFLRLP